MDISETEDKANESEGDTQFGVVWEKMKDVETKDASGDAVTKADVETTKTNPWKENPYPHVLITETEEQCSDSEEDNIHSDPDKKTKH